MLDWLERNSPAAGRNPALNLLRAALLTTAASLATPALAASPAELYQQNCLACHGASRTGAMGPALLPQSLERLKKADALATVTQGRAATQMPAFQDKLSADDIKALVDYLYTAPEQPPSWQDSDITASRIEYVKPGALPAKPVFKADPKNLFVVVEGGDHHASILDGDKLEPIYRFATRYALHGGPKFTPDGRYVYFASRDGWISKFDIWNLKLVAEVRAGLNTRNIAVSGDGKYVLAGNYLPQTLALFDADLKLLRSYQVASESGKPSRVSAVYDAAPRKSFVVALKDLPEVWEIPYDKEAPPTYKGYVHDYKMGEALALPGQFTPKVIELDTVLDDFFFDQSYSHLIGASREGRAQVVNLDIRRKIADLDLAGMPHLGSGITWEWQGKPVLASPNLKDGTVSIIDMTTWKTVKQIKTNGPGFFMRSHENTPYAWVDSMMGVKKDTLQIIDKQKLEVVGEVRPEPGKTLAHIEFTRDGKYALASLWEMDGAIIVFDAATWKEVKRLPMSKPVGKYNVYNKTTRSAGTSH
ncbi:cytochrome D1 domain-containing protein [Chitinivorax sp. PXF-14]|uniref:cytochrome D1 domain-containing protein n=1 Tax=Chitinivorax sp. PXF-14 TaxID=3230488 RepID=UPI003466E772